MKKFFVFLVFFFFSSYALAISKVPQMVCTNLDLKVSFPITDIGHMYQGTERKELIQNASINRYDVYKISNSKSYLLNNVWKTLEVGTYYYYYGDYYRDNAKLKPKRIFKFYKLGGQEGFKCKKQFW